MEPLLQHREPLRHSFVLGARMIQLRHLRCRALDLAFHGAQLVKDAEALLEDGSPGQPQPLLRQIADAHAARLLHHPVVERLETRQHLHQRGFAGAVCADQRSLFVAPDQPVGLGKQHARPKALSGILQREHSSLIFAEDSLAWPPDGAAAAGCARRLRRIGANAFNASRFVWTFCHLSDPSWSRSGQRDSSRSSTMFFCSAGDVASNFLSASCDSIFAYVSSARLYSPAAVGLPLSRSSSGNCSDFFCTFPAVRHSWSTVLLMLVKYMFSVFGVGTLKSNALSGPTLGINLQQHRKKAHAKSRLAGSSCPTISHSLPATADRGTSASGSWGSRA